MKQETALENLTRQVKTMRIYTAILTLAFLAVVYVLLERTGNFKELTAERINIVERSGKLRMVISNRERQHPGTMDNKVFPKRDRPAGMIFFNDAGDECGGLVYDGDKNSASMTYSIDQWKNDQIMQLQYAQENKGTTPGKSYGLKLWDRSDQFTLSKLIAADDSLKKLHNANAYQAGMEKLKAAGLLANQRLFVGKNENGEVGLFLSDNKGTPRLRIFINKQNQPVIETLDENGNLIASK